MKIAHYLCEEKRLLSSIPFSLDSLVAQKRAARPRWSPSPAIPGCQIIICIDGSTSENNKTSCLVYFNVVVVSGIKKLAQVNKTAA